MNSRILILLAVILLHINLCITFGQENSKTLNYILKLNIDPEKSFLQCEAKIQHAHDSCFILAKGLVVKRVTADGKKILFHQSPSSQTANSSEITINEIRDNLIIEYSGQINPDSFPKTISAMNMVRSGLVELSNHIDWYPRTKNFSPFTYRLELNLPLNYVTVSNGVNAKRKTEHNRSTTIWKSEGLSWGITFLAAPNLKKSVSAQDGMTVEIYYDKIPKSYIDSMKTRLIKAMSMLVDLYGKPGANNLLRLVYSPRAAGGYARTPLIIVSENYALEQRLHKYGFERDLRLNIHELAHYWSRANTDTPEDWLNEGLAEYSALLISEEISGKDFSDLLLKEYHGIVDNSQTGTSIIETTSDTPGREINRYYKPAILFDEIRQKYGSEKLKKFFRNLYSRFLVEKTATTEIFLDEIGKTIGTEAKVFFSDAVHKKDLNNATSDEKYSTVYDTAYIGKWTGPLTQFGTTTKFVLNLNVKDGKLVPTLDSPDQGVKDIPVSEIKISADSIMFKVAVASATYTGYLNRNNMTIIGKWEQRGTEYPLILSKNDQMGK